MSRARCHREVTARWFANRRSLCRYLALLEAINKPVLIALLASATFLFLKWPRPLLRHYAAIKYFHIAAATIYVVKFFAEPLLGGKLG